MQHSLLRAISGFALAAAMVACSDTTAPRSLDAESSVPSLAKGGKTLTSVLATPVTGTSADGLTTFVGTFTPTKFLSQNGSLLATGTLTGTLTTSVIDPITGIVTTTVQSVTKTVTFLVTSASGTCDILSLVLGPLHVDLLGLQIDLNQVVLNITAQSGAGNLLGNLLCAIAGLLDAGGPLSNLATLLNQLLGLLG